MIIGEIYKITDAHPPAFGEVTSVNSKEDEFKWLAWADWYQWDDKNVYCIHGSGYEIERLVPATADEIAIYERKVVEYLIGG
ncbi:hypothetical protein [Enterococcus dispar]|uniref:hypothetical protein n=1 Tax=Enterococcus dispar TaxID=44009 RepID=UPI0028905FC6|nr:hypothetical protein [Enterococcus dispar]MDT2705744.1 hypothetical protein [Enterococcus dispar]